MGATDSRGIAAAAALPFVRRAQELFMFVDLLQEIFECDLHRRGSGWSFALHSQLTGGQPEIEGDGRTLAS